MCAEEARLKVVCPDGGSIRIEIYDAVGTLVHDNTYNSSGGGGVECVTLAGVPGAWLLRLAFSEARYSGPIVGLNAFYDGPGNIIVVSGDDYDGTWVYYVRWPAGAATLRLSDGMAGGLARVRIWEPAGVAVLDVTVNKTWAAPVDLSSALGTPGVWTVMFDFDNADTSGELEVRHP